MGQFAAMIRKPMQKLPTEEVTPNEEGGGGGVVGEVLMGNYM